jgi:DnaK suppressor protein
VDEARARELLARERARVERMLRGYEEHEGTEELSRADQHPADVGTETFDEELSEGRREELEEELRAIERAERRLAEGRYGFSVVSGKPIPDERLELIPWADRTADEQARIGLAP